jgi:hypothetical protein
MIIRENMTLKGTQINFLAASFLLISAMAVGTLVNTSPASAVRLDACDPSDKANQQIKGSAWRGKCLNAGVREVWQDICNEMTLEDAKKSSSQNGCWKLFSDGRFAKQK